METTMTTRTPGFRPAPQVLLAVINEIALGKTLADAMRSVSMSPNTVFSWLAKSRASPDDPNWMVAWPDDQGDALPFFQAVVLAQRAHLMHFRQRLVRDVDVGTPRTLRDPSGAVVYEIDHKLMAIHEGDAESARALGCDDPFFLHDKDGARIPVVVYDPSPAALRQHAARSLLVGFNPADNQVRDVKHSGGVMIVKATGNNVRPAYARPEAAPISPLRADLLKRLADLTEHGPANPKPSAPVQVFGRPSPNDPVERTIEPTRHVQPAEHARAYQASTPQPARHDAHRRPQGHGRRIV
jgi:hypothetical protein